MVNAPELSLRGGRRPTWQSPATGCVFAEAFLLFTIVLRDSHVASLLGMTNLEPLRHKIHAAIIASLHGAQGAPLQTQSVHTVLSPHCTNCKCVAGSGMPFPATRHEGLASNENIRLTAAPRMLYTDTGGPQPVRLQENPPSQKFRREEKCESKPSGCPFAFHNPPQRQNCKIMIQKLILQFWKQLGEKGPKGLF